MLTAYGSGLGSGYADGYGGGAMKGSAYAAKAPGPYGGMKLYHCVAFLSVDCLYYRVAHKNIHLNFGCFFLCHICISVGQNCCSQLSGYISRGDVISY